MRIKLVARKDHILIENISGVNYNIKKGQEYLIAYEFVDDELYDTKIYYIYSGLNEDKDSIIYPKVYEIKQGAYRNHFFTWYIDIDNFITKDEYREEQLNNLLNP